MLPGRTERGQSRRQKNLIGGGRGGGARSRDERDEARRAEAIAAKYGGGLANYLGA